MVIPDPIAGNDENVGHQNNQILTGERYHPLWNTEGLCLIVN